MYFYFDNLQEEVEAAGGKCIYGVCFVDTTIAKFYVSIFAQSRILFAFCTIFFLSESYSVVK